MYGFADTLLYQFGGTHLCYSRSDIENYHTILAKRITDDSLDNEPGCPNE